MLYFVTVRSFSWQKSVSRVVSFQAHKAFTHHHKRLVGGGSLVSRQLSSQSEEEKNVKAVDASDLLEEYRNKNNINDQVFSAISEDGSVKVTACTARNLMNDLMIAHTMTAVPADALGRTVVCALLMSNGIQAEQTVQITLNGEGKKFRIR
jgi:molecular chaperone Hsp33